MAGLYTGKACPFLSKDKGGGMDWGRGLGGEEGGRGTDQFELINKLVKKKE